jgi:hypothetical protein
MIVPAGTEVCRRHAAHSHVGLPRSSAHLFRPPQAGQTKPSGQQRSARYRAQATRNQSLPEIFSSAAIEHLSLARPKSLWQHRAMIEFRSLPDDHLYLACSPLLLAALLTLWSLQEHRAVGLTKNMAFKRALIVGRLSILTGPEKALNKCSATARSSTNTN